tara:strand:- start:600 stop:737 length:138 start_codon:yes stop_codon:yes gene_type:complete
LTDEEKQKKVASLYKANNFDKLLPSEQVKIDNAYRDFFRMYKDKE